jgi:hypothetical protein
MATIFSGGTYVNTTFTGGVRSDIQLNIKTQLLVAGWTSVAVAAGQGPGIVSTFTVTIASPGVVTLTTHGLLGGEKVILQTTGALPTNLVVNTVYFVKYIDANTFNLAATLGGANINTSGSQSGTHTLNTESMLLQSATQTNVTNPIRVRVKDNRGNCIQISIENQAGSVAGTNSTTFGGNLLPAAAKVFRIIATQYHFLCFTGVTSAAREFVMAGMLNVPSLLASITDHGYMFSNGASDTSTSICASIRTAMTLTITLGSPNSAVIWNSSLIENGNSSSVSNAIGCPSLIVMGLPDANIGRAGHYRWANDDINTADILLSVGLTVFTDEGKIKGQFYDMIYIADAFAGDSTDTDNGHNWFNITQNNVGVGASVVRGGVWVAVS